MKKRLIILGILVLAIIITISIIKIKRPVENDKKIQDTLPYLLDDDCEVLENDVQKGMTIKDSYGNEFVWIVVPKTKVFHTARGETDYKGIEEDIKEYVKNYSAEEYIDFDIQEETLRSIFNYGGFWISRYEIGIEEARLQEGQITQQPLSQPNKYVYNYITFEQAEQLASEISGGKYMSNLLYGFQWDLVCKFIEENGYTQDGEKISEEMINSNSSLWGNYYSSSFTINRGKYSINYGENYIDAEPNEMKKAYKTFLTTTGASENNKACNIYDFAGNVSEWTLERPIDDKNWNVIRDGSFYFNYGGNDPVNGRYKLTANSNGSNYGFRICVIKQ